MNALNLKDLELLTGLEELNTHPPQLHRVDALRILRQRESTVHREEGREGGEAVR